VLATFSLLTSCATIIGGSKYYAHVKVDDYPNAKIEYKGTYQGAGNAVIKTKRAEANKFSVTIKEDDCETQTINYTQRIFRGWAFAGTIVGWTGIISGIPLPWGVAVDLSTGALWKPDITEKGVTKTDYKRYNYIIDYSGCKDDGIGFLNNENFIYLPLAKKR